MLRSVFEDFNKATDRLDNFWFDKAKISHVKILFHEQVSVEREFSLSNIVHNNNTKEDTIVVKKYIIDHISRGTRWG